MQMATPKEVLVTRAFQVALRFISYRPRSRREIRSRLLRGFQQHDVEQALERLEKQGYGHERVLVSTSELEPPGLFHVLYSDYGKGEDSEDTQGRV